MDVFLDMSFVFPAIIITLLAIIFATTLFNTKDSPNGSSSQMSDAPMGQAERVGQNVGLSTPRASANTAEKDTSTCTGNQQESQQADQRNEAVDSALDRTVVEQLMTDAQRRSHAHQKTKETNNEEQVPASEPENKSTAETARESVLSPPVSEPSPVKEGSHQADPGWETASDPALAAIPLREHIYKHVADKEPSQEESALARGAESNVEAVDAGDQSLRYVPGMLRTSQLEKMMTKEELEEEQRVQREQLAAIFQLLRDNQDTFGEVTETDVEEQLKLYSI